MNTATFQDRTLALGGMFQAARLVQQLAHEGRTDNAAFSMSIHSILMIDADSTAEVFGGANGVRYGLELMRDKLGGFGDSLDVEVARYVVSMLHLAGQLAEREDVQGAIRDGIKLAERQMKFFEPDDSGVHPSLVEKLAELYVQTLSLLPPRIMVSGEHSFLVNSLIAAKIRSALLAGVRAAFLWRQLGGRRWHLMFGRRRVVTEAKRILDDLTP